MPVRWAKTRLKKHTRKLLPCWREADSICYYFIYIQVFISRKYAIIQARSCGELNAGCAPVPRGHSQTHITWCQSSRCCLCVQRIKDLFPWREHYPAIYLWNAHARARTHTHLSILVSYVMSSPQSQLLDLFVRWLRSVSPPLTLILTRAAQNTSAMLLTE